MEEIMTGGERAIHTGRERGCVLNQKWLMKVLYLGLHLTHSRHTTQRNDREILNLW